MLCIAAFSKAKRPHSGLWMSYIEISRYIQSGTSGHAQGISRPVQNNTLRYNHLAKRTFSRGNFHHQELRIPKSELEFLESYKRSCRLLS